MTEVGRTRKRLEGDDVTGNYEPYHIRLCGPLEGLRLPSEVGNQ